MPKRGSSSVDGNKSKRPRQNTGVAILKLAGIKQLQETKLDDALATFAQVLKIDPTDQLSHLYILIISFRQGEYRNAANSANKLTLPHPDIGKTLVRLADKQLMKGQYQSALFYASRAIKLNPKFDTTIRMPNIYLAMRDYQAAHTCIKKRKELSCNDTTASSEISELENVVSQLCKIQIDRYNETNPIEVLIRLSNLQARHFNNRHADKAVKLEYNENLLLTGNYTKVMEFPSLSYSRTALVTSAAAKTLSHANPDADFIAATWKNVHPHTIESWEIRICIELLRQIEQKYSHITILQKICFIKILEFTKQLNLNPEPAYTHSTQRTTVTPPSLQHMCTLAILSNECKTTQLLSIAKAAKKTPAIKISSALEFSGLDPLTIKIWRCLHQTQALLSDNKNTIFDKLERLQEKKYTQTGPSTLSGNSAAAQPITYG